MHDDRTAYTFDVGETRVLPIRFLAQGPNTTMQRPANPLRRSLLQGAALAVLIAASVAATVRMGGYVVPRGRKLASLAAWQFVLVEHAARRIVARDREDPAIPAADDIDVAGFVDAWVSRLPTGLRRDLGRFLAYVEHVAPIAAGYTARFTRLAVLEQDQVLASLEGSAVERLRAGFEGLRSLVFLGFYRDPRTWGLIGYDGPLVGRPDGGWH